MRTCVPAAPHSAASLSPPALSAADASLSPPACPSRLVFQAGQTELNSRRPARRRVEYNRVKRLQPLAVVRGGRSRASKRGSLRSPRPCPFPPLCRSLLLRARPPLWAAGRCRCGGLSPPPPLHVRRAREPPASLLPAPRGLGGRWGWLTPALGWPLWASAARFARARLCPPLPARRDYLPDRLARSTAFHAQGGAFGGGAPLRSAPPPPSRARPLPRARPAPASPTFRR